MARVYVRSILRSTINQKAPFCLLELSYGKYRSVACELSSIKLDYSDYPKSIICRINDIYGFSIKYRHSDILLKRRKLQSHLLLC